MVASLILMLCCVISGADKDVKPLTPKQQREAAEKAIKLKMEPIEKELEKAQKVLSITKNAVVNGTRDSAAFMDGMPVITEFKLQGDKQKAIDKYAKTVTDIQSKLKPLQDELKALKKMPLPKPEPKPDPK